jgi:hypothetical protein
LADPLHTSLTLFKPRWVPRHIDVHLRAETLKVQALASGVRGADEPDFAILDAAFDLLA